jgi:hypothetical protein
MKDGEHHLKTLTTNVVAGVAGFQSMLHLSHPHSLGEDGGWMVEDRLPSSILYLPSSSVTASVALGVFAANFPPKSE